jgi:phosphomannomutase
MTIPEHIFKAYDIRGLVSGELSEELAERLGRAFVLFLQKKGADLAGKRVVVGYDMRETSVPFSKALTKGIMAAGVDVVAIGLTSTPIFNFACAHYPEHAGGIMVTASHNPAEYNGFKMTLDDGLPIGKGSGMEDIRDMVLANNFPESEIVGNESERDVLPDYLERIFSIVKPEEIKPLKVVVDAGNGMAKVSIPKVLEKLPVEVEYLYLDPDGSFPNHEANPLKESTLKDLQARVLEIGADFGFALDGDADRIGLVDETGVIVPPSSVGALIGLEVLKDHPGITMLYDLRSSMAVPELWEAAGAKHTEKCMVGHALIKKYMREKHAEFASELSLHMYFADMYNVESTDLCLLYVLRTLSRESKKLSEITVPMNKYFHSGERNFSAQGGPALGGEVFDKQGIMKKIEDHYKKEAVEESNLDDVWMKFDWGWFSVRASNTEPVLRLNLEARDKETMEGKVEELSHFIQSF